MYKKDIDTIGFVVTFCNVSVILFQTFAAVSMNMCLEYVTNLFFIYCFIVMIRFPYKSIRKNVDVARKSDTCIYMSLIFPTISNNEGQPDVTMTKFIL